MNALLLIAAQLVLGADDTKSLAAPSRFAVETASVTQNCIVTPQAKEVVVTVSPSGVATANGNLCRVDGRTVTCDQAGASLVHCITKAAPQKLPGERRVQKPTAFVFDFHVEGVPLDDSNIISDLFAAELTSQGIFAVIGSTDVEALLAIEEQKAALGCDEEGCLGEIAGVLGADYIVTGTLTALDRTTNVSVQLISVEGSVSEGDVRFDRRGLEGIASTVPLAVEALTADYRGVEKPEIPPPYLGRSLGDTSALLGAGSVGAVLLIAGALTIGVAGFLTMFSGLGVAGPTAGCVSLGLIAPFIGALSTTVTAAASDVAADVTPAIWRVAATGATGFVSFVLTSTAVFALSFLVGISVALAQGDALEETEPFNQWWMQQGRYVVGGTMIAAGGVGGAASALSSAAVYLWMVDLVGDAPLSGEPL